MHGDEEALLAKILFLSPEEDAKRISFRLQMHGYAVTERFASLDTLRDLERHTVDFDVILLDVSQGYPKEWELLDLLCGPRVGVSRRPAIVCISRTYRGPRLRMEIERRGARLVIYGR